MANQIRADFAAFGGKIGVSRADLHICALNSKNQHLSFTIITKFAVFFYSVLILTTK